jgi:hypothetical protein
MRIAAGVILCVVGVWSIFGGCGTYAAAKLGDAAGGLADVAAKLQEAAKQAGAKVTKSEIKVNVPNTGKLKIVGIVTMVAGLLAILAGVMFFINKAKILGFLAPGVGIVAEVLSILFIGFHVVTLVKILILGFCGFAATKIGAAKA